jgi:hypothetical protein
MSLKPQLTQQAGSSKHAHNYQVSAALMAFVEPHPPQDPIIHRERHFSHHQNEREFSRFPKELDSKIRVSVQQFSAYLQVNYVYTVCVRNAALMPTRTMNGHWSFAWLAKSGATANFGFRQKKQTSLSITFAPCIVLETILGERRTCLPFEYCDLF